MCRSVFSHASTDFACTIARIFGHARLTPMCTAHTYTCTVRACMQMASTRTTSGKRGNVDGDSGAATLTDGDEAAAGSVLPEHTPTASGNAVLTPPASVQKAPKRARVAVDEAAWSAALKMAEDGSWHYSSTCVITTLPLILSSLVLSSSSHLLS